MKKKFFFSNIYKCIKLCAFLLLYGRIKKVTKVKDQIKIITKKALFENSFFYKSYKIPNGRLYSNTVHDTAYIIGRYLIKDLSFQYRYKKNKQIKNGNIFENIAFKKGTPSFIKKIKGNVLSMLIGGGGKKNYWHWIFDVLPKIAILEKSNLKCKPDYYLAPSLSQKFQLESFKLLKIPSSKILSGEKFKHITCDNLLTVDHPTVFKNNTPDAVLNIPLWIIKWLRKKFIKKSYIKRKNYKKIFINRESDSVLENRKIINNQEVRNFLSKLGFRSVTLSDYSFNEQVKIFNNAQFVIGLHGGGFANIIFSKQGTKIIEIQSKQNGNAILNLANKCKLNYKRVSERNISDKLKYQNSHINVNLSNLKKVIFSYN
tara:strand:+ start:4482 stop:5600 length:1119 start_codon:yes stop_codon:yes gene_type:complete